MHLMMNAQDSKARKPSIPSNDPNLTLWGHYDKYARVEDNEREREWRETMDTILIFSGLFAAFLSRFIGDATKKLEGEQETLVSVLLYQSQQLANSSIPAYDLPPFTPSVGVVITNYLYYTSLAFVLLSAFLAMLVKGWVRDFNRGFEVINSIEERAYLRQARMEQLRKWRFSLIVHLAPFFLYLSFEAFLIGLISSLWKTHSGIAYLCIVPFAASILFHGFTFAISLQNKHSPFGSSFSDSLSKRLDQSRVVCICSIWSLHRLFVNRHISLKQRYQLLFERQINAIQKQSMTAQEQHRTILQGQIVLYLMKRVQIAPENAKVLREMFIRCTSFGRNIRPNLYQLMFVAYQPPGNGQLVLNSEDSQAIFRLQQNDTKDDRGPVDLTRLREWFWFVNQQLCYLVSMTQPLESNQLSNDQLAFLRLCSVSDFSDHRVRSFWHLLCLSPEDDITTNIVSAVKRIFSPTQTLDRVMVYHSSIPEQRYFSLLDPDDLPLNSLSHDFSHSFARWKLLFRTWMPGWSKVALDRRRAAAEPWWEPQEHDGGRLLGLGWLEHMLQNYPPQLLVNMAGDVLLKDSTNHDKEEENQQKMLGRAVLLTVGMFLPLEDPGKSTEEEIMDAIGQACDGICLYPKTFALLGLSINL